MAKFRIEEASHEADVIVHIVSKDGVSKLKEAVPGIAGVIELSGFDGGAEKALVIPREKRPWLVLSGAGRDEWYGCMESIRVAVGAAVNTVKQYKGLKLVELRVEDRLVDKAVSESNRSIEWVYEQMLVAADMADYKFQIKRSHEDEEPLEVAVTEAPRKAVERAEKIAAAVRIARDIANYPPSSMNPAQLEEEAKKLAEKYGLSLRVLHRDDLESLGMGGILAVGRGSSVEPRLIILEYSNGGRRVAVAGKAVTFDAGGLDLKSPQAMYDMKFDKSGGAAALAVAAAVASLKLPVSLAVLVPAVENLPSGSSYKPLDVIRMYNGLTVEVGNTDAEGRIILADALAYAVDKYKPDMIVDLATLTGAAVIALGNHAAALMGNNEELLKAVERAAWLAGEPAWRLPMWPIYAKQLESKVADTSNVGGRPAGAITAAKFLEKFVSDTPWAHLDIAGTAWVQDKGPFKPYYGQGGATGWGVRTMIELIRGHVLNK